MKNIITSKLLVSLLVSLISSSVFAAMPANGVIEKSYSKATKSGFQIGIPIDIYQRGKAQDSFRSSDSFVAWVKIRKGSSGKWKTFSAKAKMSNDKNFFLITIPSKYHGYVLRVNVMTADGNRHNHVNIGGSWNADGVKKDPNSYTDNNEVGYAFRLN